MIALQRVGTFIPGGSVGVDRLTAHLNLGPVAARRRGEPMATGGLTCMPFQLPTGADNVG